MNGRNERLESGLVHERTQLIADRADFETHPNLDDSKYMHEEVECFGILRPQPLVKTHTLDCPPRGMGYEGADCIQKHKKWWVRHSCLSKQSSLTCVTELLRLGNLFLYNIHSSKNHDGVALVKQGFSSHDNNIFYFSIIPAPINILNTRGPSVIKQIGFQEFLNQKKNRKKPEKKTEQPKKP